MDVVALASVISSGGVAVVTLVVNALMRRGDRKHASSLEFEKRVWERKSAATFDLITRCRDISKAAGDADDGGAEDLNQLRCRVLQTFEEHIRIEVPELIAFGSVPLNDAVARLQKVADAALRSDAIFYLLDLSELRKAKEAAVDSQDFDVAAATRNEEKELQRRVGELSNIDLDAVRHLCARAIDLARADLRGMHKT